MLCQIFWGTVKLISRVVLQACNPTSNGRMLFFLHIFSSIFCPLSFWSWPFWVMRGRISEFPWFEFLWWLRMFCILHFIWWLCQCFLWYILHLRFSLLSLVFWCWSLHPWLLTSFLGFLCLELFPFFDFFIVLPPFLDPGGFCSIPSPVGLCFPLIL